MNSKIKTALMITFLIGTYALTPFQQTSNGNYIVEFDWRAYTAFACAALAIIVLWIPVKKDEEE